MNAIKTTVNVPVEHIKIELTLREAYVLATILGSYSPVQFQRRINEYLLNPPYITIPNELRTITCTDELDKLTDLHTLIMKQLGESGSEKV